MVDQIPRIAVAWNGLPFYAARLIRAGIEAIGAEVAVIGTSPSVPIRGMEEALGQSITWIDPLERTSWESLEIDTPSLMFQTGWAVPAFNSLSSQVKRQGGRVAAFVDNIPRSDLRQFVGAGVYRLAFSRRFDALLVPGLSSRRLARKFGVPDERVFTGMLGADPSIFSPPPASARRRKEFLFVGNFAAWKGVDLLVAAFAQVQRRHPEWRLRLVGTGPLRSLLSGPGIVVEDFLQPDEVVDRYRDAAFFILPSRDEHWGVVVHEAALCGNVLLVSESVGAAPDLVDEENGFVFPSERVAAMIDAMERAIALPESVYRRMSASSVEKASSFGPAVWADAFERMVAFLWSPEGSYQEAEAL